MTFYRIFIYVPGILAKVRESAENMQHKIQSRSDGLNAKYSEKGNAFFTNFYCSFTNNNVLPY